MISLYLTENEHVLMTRILFETRPDEHKDEVGGPSYRSVMKFNVPEQIDFEILRKKILACRPKRGEALTQNECGAV